MICQKLISTPLGPCLLTASHTGLQRIQFRVESTDTVSPGPGFQILEKAERQLVSYFNGTRKEFDIALDWSGFPKFYQSVWDILLSIPYGETRSYSDIARIMGRPNAVRAVGMANSKNPLPIVVPCHRVIGKKGQLAGFAYGVEMKRWLLNWEWEHSETKQGWLF